MISAIRGTVLHLSGSTVVIEVGGIGFSVQVTPAHALSLRVGKEARLLTNLIVREDALSLFGFSDQASLDIFALLVGVTGVGPKSALAVLAELSPSEIAEAVNSDDDAVFRRVSGIGPKTAKLIVVSLTGKVLAATAGSRAKSPTSNQIRDDVLAALMGLGWSDRHAMQALDRVLVEASELEKSSVHDLLRRALTELGPGQAKAGGKR